MKKYFLFLITLILMLFSIDTMAQQSSKSKSKDRFRSDERSPIAIKCEAESQKSFEKFCECYLREVEILKKREKEIQDEKEWNDYKNNLKYDFLELFDNFKDMFDLFPHSCPAPDYDPNGVKRG